jgi:Domain of unknown function (DUF4123)
MTTSIAAQSGAPEWLSAAAISERLYNLTRQHDSRYAHIYLLLDRHSEHPLKEAIQALADSDKLCLPLADEVFKDNPEQSPLLVCLQTQQPQHLQLLEQSIALALEQASQASSLRSMCAWIITNAPPQRLQSALTQKLKAYWPNNQSIYLRYFDPRVMPRLMHILPSQQQAQLLGPVHIWCQLGRDGQWHTHRPVATTHASQASEATTGHLRLGASLAQAVDRIELVNLSAAQLARQGHSVPHSQDAAIDTALQTAQSLGLANADDAIAYAWRALLHASPFTAHPALPQLIQQARTDHLPLEALLAERLSQLPTQPLSKTLQG